MITIHNLRNEKPKSKFTHVKICRPSPLGNPFILGKDGDRDEVCNKYEIWFCTKVRAGDDTKFNSELNRIKELYLEYGELSLFCWCTPERCHAETIKKHLEI